MSMPETAIYKDNHPILRQHYIRLPRQPLIIHPIPKALPPKPFPHYYLWLRILATYGRHIYMALLGGEGVGHGEYDKSKISFTFIVLNKYYIEAVSYDYKSVHYTY